MSEHDGAYDVRAILAAAMREDLLTFAGKAIPELDHHPLVIQPHVELMAAAVGQLFEGKTNALMVNVAPRLLKSRLTTVCFTAWLIGKKPAHKVMIVSHDQALADKLVDDIRKLVTAPWYAEAFPHAAAGFEHARSGDFKMKSGAEVIAKSVDGKVTGFGFDLMIFDDPIDAGDADNPTARERLATLFDTRFRSRLESQGESQTMIVAQRTHRDDLCGHVAGETRWLRLVVPLLAPEDLTHRVGDYVWNRPAGHVLDEDRYPAEWIENQQRLRPQLFASQCQQQPMLSETTILKREWFRSYEGRAPLEAHTITISVDTASSLKKGSAYTCMLVWATDGIDHYLLEVVRDRMLIDSMQERLLRLIVQFRPRTVLIEEYSSGAALIRATQQALLSMNSATSVKITKPQRSKQDRLREHVDIFANGHIFVPLDRPFGVSFIDEHLMFETGGFADQVDCTTQYLDHARGVIGPLFNKILTHIDRPMPLSAFKPTRFKDQGFYRKPAHGVPSIRDPKAPRPRRS